MPNLWGVRQDVREASKIFLFGARPSPEKIEQSLATLEVCRRWAKDHTIAELENDALWGIYLCHSRLDQPSPAADALLQLRRNLETTRKGIKNPLERGGVFQAFPMLFDALCEKLSSAGRTQELLECIEASKGRGVADILTQRTEAVVADDIIYDSVKDLTLLARVNGLHYLTYHVNNEWTYAVLVSKQGGVYPIGPIAITRSKIREASQNVDPHSWGSPAEYDSAVVVDNVSELLTPLVEPLQPLIDDGILEFGDQICCSVDDNFHNIPLQYLKFDGKPLIDSFSVSRIHSAFHLKNVLRGPANGRYSEFVSFVVPLQQDLRGDIAERKLENLRRPSAELSHYLLGRLLEKEWATLEHLRSEKLTNKIVHFSTHGIFPRIEENQNPFYQSGLVLADSDGLPDQDAVARGVRDSVLTPSKVLNMQLDFGGSHVSLMACVSGLSREGLGGDALGMDWAFIQAGAASVLSSHWYVSAGLAAVFFERFYYHWVAGKKSRAEAYLETIKDLRAGEDALAHLHSWAAFSLTGDWR
jgi:CHAT domain-containing protein